MNLKIPVSIGELIDKITILNIKKQKIFSEQKKKYIIEELNILYNYYNNFINDILKNLEVELFEINLKLWDVEDKLRIMESNKIFDSDFINLARSVYILNDKRFEIKNKINNLYNSEIREQKSYEKY